MGLLNDTSFMKPAFYCYGFEDTTVIHGLLNAFSLLLETFCREAQTFINLLSLMIKSSDEKLELNFPVDIFHLFRYCLGIAGLPCCFPNIKN